MKLKQGLILFCAGLLMVACVSSTKGGAVGSDRRQFFAVSSGQINAESGKEYAQLLADAERKGTLDRNPAELHRIQAIVRRLTPQTQSFRDDAPGWGWDAHAIAEDQVNAFCMPGGKIIVYSALIEKLNLNDAELAAVLGHEISHALREHGRERYSQQLTEQILEAGALEGLLLAGKVTPEQAKVGGAVGGVLSHVLIDLPHSRGQETEADTIGVELMARAGYDPHEALNLWQKMARLNQGGNSIAQRYLSDHPADDQRLAHIRALLPKVIPLYEAAVRK